MAGGALTGGGGTPLPQNFPLSEPLCKPFGMPLERPLEGASTKRRPIKVRLVFAFEVAFICTFSFVKRGLVGSTGGALCRRRGIPNGSI